MQILSIVQWYHFAYMIISVALLGFGASGTFITLFRNWFLSRIDLLLPFCMIASGAAMSCVVPLAQSIARFDSYLLFVDSSHIWLLVLTYVLFFIPFLLGAFAIGLVFIRFTEQIGSLYFSNLLGSGLGAVVPISLAWFFLPSQLPSVIAALAIVSGLILFPTRKRILFASASAVSFLISIYFFFHFPFLQLSQYKSLSRTLNLPDAHVVFERNSPYGFVQVVSSIALRYAPGLSLTYQGEFPIQEAVFHNGNWFGTIDHWKRTDTSSILDYATNALPYAMAPRKSLLIFNVGAGFNLSHAVSRNVNRIIAVQHNAVILDMMKNDFAQINDSLFYHPSLSLQQVEPRTFLSIDTASYDLIVLPTIDAFGGTSGLNALQEQYLLTVDAFQKMWQRLTPRGAITVTTWMDYPFRNSLKVLATIVEMLEREGVTNSGDYVAAVRGWATITFTVTRSSITPDEIQRIKFFCERMNFDPALLPEMKPEERVRFNQMEDDTFFEYLDKIISPDRKHFYEQYDFTIQPSTDDRPFFSQFIRWKSLPHFVERIGQQSIPFLELGYALVVVTCIQIALVALILIILPLFRMRWKGKYRVWNILYFGGLGLGYMFVEIVLIQMFTLYFGHPIYAAAAVISTMLICSGLGSFVSSRMNAQPDVLLKFSSTVCVIIILYALVLTSILQSSIASPLALKVIFSFSLIGPLAFVMGFPFPLGLRFIANNSTAQVPWAWGINGCMSVLSTALSTVASVEIGFIGVLFIAAAAYGVSMLTNLPQLHRPVQSQS